MIAHLNRWRTRLLKLSHAEFRKFVIPIALGLYFFLDSHYLMNPNTGQVMLSG